MKHLERAANLSVILGVTVFLVLAVRGELLKRQTADTSPHAIIGKTLSLPGVNFPPQHNSLVLALSTTCHFCKESLPFYRDLAGRLVGQIDVIAVLPQPQPEGQSYMRQATVNVKQVVSAGLGSIGVHGTPTILLVDSTGKVINVWVGLLNQKGQQEVLADALAKQQSSR